MLDERTRFFLKNNAAKALHAAEIAMIPSNTIKMEPSIDQSLAIRKSYTIQYPVNTDRDRVEETKPVMNAFL